MNQTPRHIAAVLKKRWKLTLLATAAALCLGAGVGDVLWVKWVALPIRDGKFAFSKTLATAKQGEQISVLAVDETRWVKVRYFPPNTPSSGSTMNYIEGYVYEDSLDSSEVKAADAAATTQSVQAGTAGASRGLLDAGKYASEKGLSQDYFKKMIKDGDDVTGNNPNFSGLFENFTTTAGIGPHKGMPTTAPVQ